MKTLRSKFFLLILVPVIAVFIFLEIRNYRTANALLIDQMDKNARHYLWAASESLSGNIGTIRTVLSLEALDENISQKSDNERRQMFITLTWKLGALVTSVYMGYPDGRMIRGASTKLPADYDNRQRSWYRSALQLPKGKTEGVTAPYIDAGTGRPVITFFRKVMNVDKSIIGVLGVDIDIQKASQSITQGHPIPPGGQKILVKSNGTILIHPDPKRVGKRLEASGDPFNKRLADDIHNLDIASQMYLDKRQDALWYAGFHRVEGTDLALVFMVPAKSILKPLNRLHMESIPVMSSLAISVVRTERNTVW